MFKVSTEYDEYEIDFCHNPPPPQFVQMWKNGELAEDDFKDAFGTKCTIHNLTTGAIIEGWTFLNPRDQYDRNKGRKIALADAMKQAFFDRNTRSKFWQAYYKTRGNKW